MALTAFGVTVLTFMMVMYAMERRGRIFVLGFALGCGLSSVYGFLAGAWSFGVVEAIWAVIAIGRYERVGSQVVGWLRASSPAPQAEPQSRSVTGL